MAPTNLPPPYNESPDDNASFTPPTPDPPSLSSAPPQVPRTPTRPPHTYSYRTPDRSGHTLSWAKAGAETQGVSSASPRRLIPKSKPRTKKGGYVVFCNLQIGAFRLWDDVLPLVTRVPNSLYQGYPTLLDAQAAFKDAQERGWTRALALAPDGSMTAPLVPPPSPANPQQGSNPLHAGRVADSFWYVVYHGITPGVYASSLECSLNTQGLSGALSSLAVGGPVPYLHLNIHSMRARAQTRQIPRDTKVLDIICRRRRVLLADPNQS
ncbi:hypothetical protein B0H16DRAFT_1733353 [Mycena metata]|uniref:Uncharacterized protein n=1 Tax=Mycena metata TaxID=1033252 RepID=A0AAD7MUN2_9AGAR|nr:hypothetical protein B0H16DRAFT_1733353 [Mycena metata]